MVMVFSKCEYSTVCFVNKMDCIAFSTSKNVPFSEYMSVQHNYVDEYYMAEVYVEMTCLNQST